MSARHREARFAVSRQLRSSRVVAPAVAAAFGLSAVLGLAGPAVAEDGAETTSVVDEVATTPLDGAAAELAPTDGTSGAPAMPPAVDESPLEPLAPVPSSGPPAPAADAEAAPAPAPAVTDGAEAQGGETVPSPEPAPEGEEPQAQPDLQPETDAQAQPEPQAQPDLQPETDAQAQPEPQSGPDLGTDPEPEQQPEPQSQPEPQTEPDPGTSPEPEPHAEPELQARPAPAPVTQSAGSTTSAPAPDAGQRAAAGSDEPIWHPRPSAPLPQPTRDAVISASGWSNPTIGRLTSDFGHRVHPVLGIVGMHAGQDVANACGTPIHAAAAGTVVWAGGALQGRTGNQIVIAHGDGVVTRYGHLLTNSFRVDEGDEVRAGQHIAGMGGDAHVDPIGAGNSTGCHLHFEVNTHNGLNPVDPLAWLADRGVTLGVDDPGVVHGGDPGLVLAAAGAQVPSETGPSFEELAAEMEAGLRGRSGAILRQLG